MGAQKSDLDDERLLSAHPFARSFTCEDPSRSVTLARFYVEASIATSRADLYSLVLASAAFRCCRFSRQG